MTIEQVWEYISEYYFTHVGAKYSEIYKLIRDEHYEEAIDLMMETILDSVV